MAVGGGGLTQLAGAAVLEAGERARVAAHLETVTEPVPAHGATGDDAQPAAALAVLEALRASR